MKSCILEARTVALVRDLKVEQRQGANGTFESKDILMRVAVDRDYKVTRTENGKTISEYPTDFWLAKATGSIAQVLKDYCTTTKEDGKLISRHLLLSGSFENYTNTRKVKVAPQVNIGGQVYQLDLEVEVPNNNNTIFVIDSIKFLDRNPENVQANGSTSVTTAVATPVAQPATPVAQPVVAQSAPVAQPAQEAQPVVTPVQATTVQPAVNLAGAMNPPVVDPAFVAAGQTAPF